MSGPDAAGRFNAKAGAFFRKRPAPGGGGGGWGAGAARSITSSPSKRALRSAVTEAYVWDNIKNEFQFVDVSDRGDVIAEVKLGIGSMRELNDLFDELDADSNGAVELRDFRSLTIDDAKAKEVWDAFRTWTYQGMNVKDNPNTAIERREYMRAMKRDIKVTAEEKTFNPVVSGLYGKSMSAVVPFLATKFDEIAHQRVAWLREQIGAYISGAESARLGRVKSSGEKEFPDLGDVHDILFVVPLTAVAAEKLKDLWNKFDKNKDGVISDADFKTAGELRIWSELRANFDVDGDGAVSGDEFVSAFKRLVFKSSAIPYENAACPLAEAVHQFTDFASDETINHIDEISVHCGFKEGVSAVLKYPEIKQRFGAVQVDEAMLTKIEALFKALDVDGSGVLEMEDFLKRVGEKKEASKQYEALWQSFDADDNAKITFIEFATRIIDHVVQAPAAAVPSLPVEEQVAAMNSHLNGELNTQCEALKLFFGV